ncbi:hypothetical protein EBR96_10315, partial [bacterium]|nr:hypothetical protein [bacterium]
PEWSARGMPVAYLWSSAQGFVTDNGDALMSLFSNEINGREYERTIHEVASRLATVFASLKVSASPSALQGFPGSVWKDSPLLYIGGHACPLQVS